MRTVLDGRYRLKNSLGSGGFACVYAGEDVSSHGDYAIKVENEGCKSANLEMEMSIYRNFGAVTGFPVCYGEGVDNERHYLVLERLGKSVRTIVKDHKNRLSLKTVLMLIEQMLNRVEYVHNKGIIHRDVKPSNFLVGTGPKSNTLYLIDFGLSARYVHSDGVLKRARARSDFAGTVAFASINSMNGGAVSRKDDMESLAYVFIWLLRGRLPWKGLASKDRHNSFSAILSLKNSSNTTDLCQGLPEPFGRYLESVMTLGFSDRPDYSGYRRMFRDLFITEGFVYDCRFDWLNRVRPQLSFTPETLGPMTPPKPIHRNNSVAGVSAGMFTSNDRSDSNRTGSTSVRSGFAPGWLARWQHPGT